MQKQLAILGATGSVGSQALDVVRARGYRVPLLTARSNIRPLERAVRELGVERVAVTDERAARALSLSLADTPCRVYGGEAGLLDAIADLDTEVTYLNAILGAAGLRPSLAVIDRGARLALANKETLVCAGELVMARSRERKAQIIPVDSEHCAIFQCLHAGTHGELRRILLTASGGPFYGYTREQLRTVSREQVLAHPTWNMGKKITVDSATLMNKGFEILEAVHLFDVDPSKIEVVIHRESIIHSAVEYIDNTVIAELSVPDMRSCVQYAVDYPARREATIPPLDLFSLGKLTFLPPDEATFTPLSLARRAATLGGGMGAVLNAADEVAVAHHLSGELAFYRISEILEEVFSHFSTLAPRESTLDGILLCDAEARRFTESLMRKS